MCVFVLELPSDRSLVISAVAKDWSLTCSCFVVMTGSKVSSFPPLKQDIRIPIRMERKGERRRMF